ncbi:MAG: endolytic transglycosylase MltG [Myxococcales bacterium]
MRSFLLALAALAALGAAAAGVAAWRFQRWTETAFGAPGERVVEVATAETLSELGAALEGAGVVDNGFRFYLLGRLRHARQKLKRGEYAFDGAMSPEQVLAHLLAGKVKTYKITVPEGLRLDEVAPLFARAGVADGPALLAAMRDPELMKRLGVPAKTAEGFLFPDTYVVPKGRKPAALVAEMVQHFQAAYAHVRAEPGAASGLNELQTVTLASIVEKETGAASERPHISCVFHNRLRRGMKLQTDPTVIYAVLLATGRFDGNLTKQMLLTPHPYNTYTTAGLPPGPISNPGLAALEAALHPLACKDLYFVARGDGTSAFCPDLVCQNRNVQRYQIAPFVKHAQR